MTTSTSASATRPELASGTVTAVAVVQKLRAKTWEEPLTTAIDKGSVDGRVPVGRMGLAGDVQCDRKHHGGEYQAVYAYADEDADWWAGELGIEIPAGRFGENLRTGGIDVTGAEIGEQWQIGDPEHGVLLEVTSARVPCRTFAEHMGQPRWVKRFTQRNTLGAYFRVLRTGTVAAGDAISVVQRPGHGVTIGDVGTLAEPEKMQHLLAAAAELGLTLDPSMRRFATRTAKRAAR